MTEIQNQHVWIAVWNSTAPDGAFTDKVENLSALLDALDQAMIDENSIHKISGVMVEYTINQIGLNIYLKAEGEGNWMFYDLIPMAQPTYYQTHLEQFKEFMRKKGIHVTSIKQRQD